MESDVSLKIGVDTPQGMGSSLTYARRYGRSMALDLSADDDDDGNLAQPKLNGQKKPEPASIQATIQNAPQKFVGSNIPPTLLLPQDRATKAIERFKEFHITGPHLEQYFEKPLTAWDDKVYEEIGLLWKEFKHSKKDVDGFLYHLQTKDL